MLRTPRNRFSNNTRPRHRDGTGTNYQRTHSTTTTTRPTSTYRPRPNRPIRDGKPKTTWTDTSGNTHYIKPKRHDLLVGNAVQHQDSQGHWHAQWTPEYAQKIYGPSPKPNTNNNSSSNTNTNAFGDYSAPVNNNAPSTPKPPTYGQPHNILDVPGPKPGDYMTQGIFPHQSVPDITQSEHIADIDGLQLYSNPTGGYYFVHHDGPLPQNTFHLGDLSGQDYFNVMVKPAQVTYKPDLFTPENIYSMHRDLMNKIRDAIKYYNTNPYDYDLLMLQANDFLNAVNTLKENDPKLYASVHGWADAISEKLSTLANMNKPYWNENNKPVSLGGNYVIGEHATQSNLAPLQPHVINQVYHYDPEEGYINPVYHIETLTANNPNIQTQPENEPYSTPTPAPTPADDNNNVSGYSSGSSYNSGRSYAPVTYRKYAEEIVRDPKKLGSLPKNVFSKFYQRHRSAIKKYIQNPTYANKLGLVNEIKFALKKGEW